MVVDRGGISDLVKVVDFGLVKDLGAKISDAAPLDPNLTAGDASDRHAQRTAPSRRRRATATREEATNCACNYLVAYATSWR